MHIAFLIPTLDRIGGAEQQVILLARSLARRGRRVSVIALSGTGGDAAADLQSNGIAFVSLRMRKGLADSGLNPTTDPNKAFFVGRNPA